ncbi:MAG: hypothetical protein QJR08_04400 [Bacillota bacterium]|nr:hypothetical protein [Bacillota bacterium]
MLAEWTTGRVECRVEEVPPNSAEICRTPFLYVAQEAARVHAERTGRPTRIIESQVLVTETVTLEEAAAS